MENASKALIIAGEILIGVLILSLASYIIIQFGDFSRNMNEKMDMTEVTRFNVNFTNYANKANISAQEIATLVNFAKQNNNEYEATLGDDYFVDVCIDSTSILEKDINEFLSENKNNTYYYCNLTKPNIIKSGTDLEIIATSTNADITYNKNTTRVNKINFHPITDIDYVTALLYGNNIVWEIR